MKNLIAALALLVSPLAASAETHGLPAFNFTGAAQLRAEKSADAAPAPRARATDVITRSHMFIQTGKEVLFGHAATQEQFVEAAAYWSEVLKAAGIEPGAPVLKDGMFVLPYRAADGRVLRSFLADARQFPPKDENALRGNMALVRQSLAAAGLTPVSARVVDLEGGYLLPTYSLLYLVKPEAAVEREIQARVFKPGDDVPVELIRTAPEVTIVQLPETWLLVYIGPELGRVGLWAKTQEDLAVRLEKRKALLAAAGKRFIAERFSPIDDAQYKFGVEILFFQ